MQYSILHSKPHGTGDSDLLLSSHLSNGNSFLFSDSTYAFKPVASKGIQLRSSFYVNYYSATVSLPSTMFIQVLTLKRVQ
jgi:hypothetical protein